MNRAPQRPISTVVSQWSQGRAPWTWPRSLMLAEVTAPDWRLLIAAGQVIWGGLTASR